MLYPVILCGGTGSRLWPVSREAYPKQFLDLLDCGKSMLQQTADRVADLPDVGSIVAVCNESYRFLVAEQLKTACSMPVEILLEPEAKNTAPAIMLAALKLLETDSDARLLVLPSDHAIKDEAEFRSAVMTAVAQMEAQQIVTFGIVPERAETGYGYIEVSDGLDKNSIPVLKSIRAFTEKPDAVTAQRYMQTGKHYWNSGMFLFSAKEYVAQIDQHAPDIGEVCRTAMLNAVTDMDFIRVSADDFSRCPSDSIDYAVMEKTDHGAVFPLSVGWSDVGSWDSVYEYSEKDNDQNVLTGDVVPLLSTNSFIYAESRLVTTLGINNTIVIETPDAVLVADRSKSQDIKQLITRLKSQGKDEAVDRHIVYRPWGNYQTICLSDRFQVKKIVVNPGQKLSMQKHFHRAEHWVVVKGTALVTCDDQQFQLNEDQSTYIPIGSKHRLENQGKIPLEIIEVQSGSYLGEDDIVRFDDVYGRAK